MDNTTKNPPILPPPVDTRTVGTDPGLRSQLVGAIQGLINQKTTPVVSPTMDAAKLGKPTNPYNIPTPEPKPTTSNLALTNNSAASQAATEVAAPPPEPKVDENKKTVSDYLKNIISGSQTYASDVAKINTDEQLARKRQQAQSLSTELDQLDKSYRDEVQGIKQNTGGASAGSINSRAAAAYDRYQNNRANLALVAKVANEDYQGAQQIVSDKVQALKDQHTQEIQNYQLAISAINNDLTESEKLQAQAQLTRKENEAKALQDTYNTVLAQAVQNKAPASVLATIDTASRAPNANSATIYQAAGQYAVDRYKEAQIANLSATTREKLANLSGETDQNKLEQQYRQILVKEVQSRSGTLGTEDAKVVQANHLASLLNQYYDPKNGNYNVPRSQYGELVLGLAGMLSKTGTPTDSQTENILQRTAKGDLAGAITYITGAPITGTTQGVLKNLADSIARQAITAESNRQAAIDLLHGLAPTQLDQNRRDALEKNTLVKFAGIKGIAQSNDNPQTADEFINAPIPTLGGTAQQVYTPDFWNRYNQ